jgi:hypothetical protein
MGCKGYREVILLVFECVGLCKKKPPTPFVFIRMSRLEECKETVDDPKITLCFVPSSDKCKLRRMLQLRTNIVDKKNGVHEVGTREARRLQERTLMSSSAFAITNSIQETSCSTLLHLPSSAKTSAAMKRSRPGSAVVLKPNFCDKLQGRTNVSRYRLHIAEHGSNEEMV